MGRSRRRQVSAPVPCGSIDTDGYPLLSRSTVQMGFCINFSRKQDEGTCHLPETTVNLQLHTHTMSLRLYCSLLNPIQTHLPCWYYGVPWLSNGSTKLYMHLLPNRPADLLGVVPTVGMNCQLLVYYFCRQVQSTSIEWERATETYVHWDLGTMRGHANIATGWTKNVGLARILAFWTGWTWELSEGNLLSFSYHR
jgi:hypothetical protein